MGPQNFPDLLMNLTELVGKPARLYANPTCLERMAPMRAISPRHDSQVAAMMGKVDDLVDAYHSSLSTTLAPSSITLNSFAKFFVVVWVYTASPVLACKELAENPGAGMSMGFFLALGYTFMTALFFFGLYEAGTIMEKPVAAVTQLVPLDDLKYALSADLTDLVDDPEDSVPIFLTPP